MADSISDNKSNNKTQLELALSYLEVYLERKHPSYKELSVEQAAKQIPIAGYHVWRAWFHLQRIRLDDEEV